MKKCLLPALSLVSSISFCDAAGIFAPGDTILGGARVGANFEVGVGGFTEGVNNWPGGEAPADIINGVIGGGGEKYLNFAELDTGVIITPAVGASIVTSMELWVANDSPERDPASFEIWGTNSSILGGGPFDIGSTFTQISVGALALPDARDEIEDTSGISQVVTIGNGSAYTSYLILFPTVKDDAGANSMQLSEIQFDGTIVPEPGSAMLLLLSSGAFFLRRKR